MAASTAAGIATPFGPEARTIRPTSKPVGLFGESWTRRVWRPAGERDRSVRLTRRHRERPARQRIIGRAGDAHRERPAVDRDQIRQAVPRERRGHRRALHTGDPELGDPDRHDQGAAVQRAHPLDPDGEAATVECRKGHGRRRHTGRRLHRHRREVDPAARAVVGGDLDPFRDRVPAVGDHLQVEVVERGRRRELDVHLRPGKLDVRMPRGSGVAIECRRRTAAGWSSRSLDVAVTPLVVASGRPKLRSRASSAAFLLSTAVPESVKERAVGRSNSRLSAARSIVDSRRHHDREWMRGRSRPERGQQRLRHAHRLADLDRRDRCRVGDADLGEAHRVARPRSLGLTLGHAVERQRELREGPAREVERLSLVGARPRAECARNRLTAVEAQPDPADEPPEWPLRVGVVVVLHDIEVVGRDWMLELDLQPLLLDDVAPVHQPRRAGITVERARRTLFRGEAERGPRPGRPNRLDPVEDRDGLGGVGRPREHLEPLVGGVREQRLLACLLRVAVVVSKTGPPHPATPVRVGDHQRRALRQ